MKALFFILCSLFVFSSCEWYEDVDVVQVGRVNLDKLSGSDATINVDVEISNPNFYNIKIKPSFVMFSQMKRRWA